MTKPKPAIRQRSWPERYTVIEQTAAESTVWAYRLSVTGAASADEAKKIYEAAGYEVIAKGYGPTGEWGYKMRKTPGETYLFSPESAEIHKIVRDAWDKAAPPFSNRVRSKLYHVLHGAFFSHYHSEYMPSDKPARQDFAQLWDKINGKRFGCDWAANPWVWVLTFKRSPALDSTLTKQSP